jgi:hypothetical protein
MGGRDADAIARRIDDLAAMGVTRVILGSSKPNRLGEVADSLRERFGMEV